MPFILVSFLHQQKSPSGPQKRKCPGSSGAGAGAGAGGDDVESDGERSDGERELVVDEDTSPAESTSSFGQVMSIAMNFIH